MITTMQSKLKMNLCIAPTETSHRKLSRLCKNYLFSKDDAIVQSYANHDARIIDQHLAEESRQTAIRVYFRSL